MALLHHDDRSPEQGDGPPFWQDFLVIVLLGALLAAAIAGLQPAKAPAVDAPAGVSLSQAPPPTKAEPPRSQGNDDAFACSDLDHAYQRC
jgi:hypothetical protein